jgi:hypothetical protein
MLENVFTPRSLSTLGWIVLVGMGVAVVPVLTIFLFNDDNSLPHDSEHPLAQPLAAPKDPGAKIESCTEREAPT